MLLNIVSDDGSIMAELPNDTIPETTLRLIHEWKMSGTMMDDIIDRLRSQTVPHGYPVHEWIPGDDLLFYIHNVFSITVI